MQPRELVNCHVRELNSPTHQFTNSPILDLAVLVELNTGDLAELADAQDLGSCVRKDVWVRLPQSPAFAPRSRRRLSRRSAKRGGGHPRSFGSASHLRSRSPRR